MTAIINVNGALVPEAEARVSVLDQSFLYGLGLFETVRASGGRLFRSGAHLQRLRASAPVLDLTISWTDAEFEQAMLRTLAARGLLDALVRLTVTRGISDRPLGLPAPGSQFYCVAARPRATRGPATAAFAPFRVHSSDPLRRLKSIGFGPNFVAYASARRRGSDEAILLNERDHVTEASTANVFIVSGGIVSTPPVSSGCLPGVTRAAILDLAPSLGIASREESVTADDLLSADEAFITSSGAGVRTLLAVDGRAIGSGRCPVTEQIAACFEELVRRETAG